MQSDDVEDNQEVLNTIATMLRSGQNQFRMKSVHYFYLLYRVGVCDTLAECVEVYKLMTDTPLDMQTDIARRWIGRYGKTVEKVAVGSFQKYVTH